MVTVHYRDNLVRKETTRGVTLLKHFNLYHKFALTMILLGLLPMLLLATFIANKMVRDYSRALSAQYDQASEYVLSSMESVFDNYNTISKMPYFYNMGVGNGADSYLSFDHFRKILTGEEYETESMETDRQRDMQGFLQYLQSVDNYINSVHVLAGQENGQNLSFHYSVYNSFFSNEEKFEELVSYEGLDRENKNLILIPPHTTAYYYGEPEQVFTIARNYFDLRGTVGHTPYVATIFIDVDLKRIEKIFQSVDFVSNEQIYVVDEDGKCFYSNNEEVIGSNLTQKLQEIQKDKNWFVVSADGKKYGLSVYICMDTGVAFSNIRNMQRLMYGCIFLSILLLFAGSFYFSDRLTKPMQRLVNQMKKVGKGNFDIEIPVQSSDEIGTLAESFNEMSQELKKYIDQSYLAQIRQNEAELTALKSQIYPHFLYNTLEIIRMTALEDEEKSKVPEMIEALSQQIHYIIGPMQDLVPLEQEIDIVRKYVYLLNCRISGKVKLMVNAQGASMIQVPKLILQPLVENAYVHGIKPKQGSGSIMIEAHRKEDTLEISVMDNGVGMDQDSIDKILQLLQGDAPGIKNQYNWQSIGLKNVHDRIRYLYGEEYGIQITSTVGVGTMISVILPWNTEEKGENPDDKDDIGG